MNDTLLVFIFSLVSFILLVIGVINKKNTLHTVSLSILANSILVLPFDYLGMDSNRIFGIPVGYFPIYFSIFSVIIASKGIIQTLDKKILGFAFIFLGYSLFQSIFIISNFQSFFVYYFMWILHIGIALFTSSFVSKQNEEFLLRFLKGFISILCVASIIGIIKYSVGIQSDANLFPLINRNGSAFIVVISLPIIFLLRDRKSISKTCFVAVNIILIFSIVLIQSRMGLIGLISSYIIYIFLRDRSFVKKAMKILFPTIAIFGLLFFTPISEKLVNRFEQTINTVKIIIHNEPIYQSTGDFARIELLKYGIAVIKKYPFLGTGIGLENYRDKLESLNIYLIRESKAHNFYISYLAELGVIGFLILLIFLVSLIKRMKNLSIQNDIFKTYSNSFLTMMASTMLMFTMNEYITLPLLWFLIGIGLGVQSKNFKHKE